MPGKHQAYILMLNSEWRLVHFSFWVCSPGPCRLLTRLASVFTSQRCCVVTLLITVCACQSSTHHRYLRDRAGTAGYHLPAWVYFSACCYVRSFYKQSLHCGSPRYRPYYFYIIQRFHFSPTMILPAWRGAYCRQWFQMHGNYHPLSMGNVKVLSSSINSASA